MAIPADLGLGPGDDLKRRRWQGQHGRLLDRLKYQQGRCVRGAVVARSSHPQAPPLRAGIDLLQAPKRSTRPKALAYEGNLPLDPRFVLLVLRTWRDRSSSQNDGPTRVTAVEQRIGQVRVQHPAFEIGQDDSARGGAQARERP